MLPLEVITAVLLTLSALLLGIALSYRASFLEAQNDAWAARRAESAQYTRHANTLQRERALHNEAMLRAEQRHAEELKRLANFLQAGVLERRDAEVYAPRLDAEEEALARYRGAAIDAIANGLREQPGAEKYSDRDLHAEAATLYDSFHNR